MTTPLQRIREKKGFTQREVANANDIDPGQYSRIERGLENVTPKVAEKLAKHFNGEISELELLYPKRYQIKDESASSRPAKKAKRKSA